MVQSTQFACRRVNKYAHCDCIIATTASKSVLLVVCLHRVEFIFWRAGVIGRRMKMDAFVPAIPELVKSLGASKDDAHRAAVAITTTDLVSKEAALQVRLEVSLRTSAGTYLQGCKRLYCGTCTFLYSITVWSVVSLSYAASMLGTVAQADWLPSVTRGSVRCVVAGHYWRQASAHRWHVQRQRHDPPQHGHHAGHCHL
jgi:hypothetical protein